MGEGPRKADPMTSINEVAAVTESINYQVDDSKRKQLVCVHWIKNRCTRGDECDYLHAYIEEKVPVCRFYQQNGHCHKEQECVYRHPKPEEGGAGTAKKSEACPFFERGFCKVGVFECQFLHEYVEKPLCQDFLLGFCPLGPQCPGYHLKSMLNPQQLQLAALANFPPQENWCDYRVVAQPPPAMQPFRGEQKIICHRCGVEGHKSSYCQEEKIPDLELNSILAQNPASQIQNFNVTCFSCY